MALHTMAVLLHGDCLELMKDLPDKSVDLFLCDLPYGCLTNKRGTRDTGWGHEGEPKKIETLGCAWDIPLDLTQFWIQVKRLCRDDHTPVLMFCSTKFGFELYNSNPDWFRYDLVWNKMRGVSFLSANKMPMRSHEMVYVFAKKGATYYRTDTDDPSKKERKGDGRDLIGNVYNPNTDRNTSIAETSNMPAGKRCVLSVVEVGSTAGRGKHPTQKPDDLYEWLITRYSKPGDTVLDPTAGSFASVFTAQRLGRNGIGMEKDKDFYDRAVEKSS